MLNPEGSACGFSLIEDKVRLYFLPGVPDQMRYLMDKVVLPEILTQYQTLPVVRQRILRLYGISEPSIAEILKDLPERIGNIVLGFYPHFPENHITIILRGHDEPTVIEELDRTETVRDLARAKVESSWQKLAEAEAGARPEELREAEAAVAAAEARVKASRSTLDLAVAGPRKEDIGAPCALRQFFNGWEFTTGPMEEGNLHP